MSSPPRCLLTTTMSALTSSSRNGGEKSIEDFALEISNIDLPDIVEVLDMVSSNMESAGREEKEQLELIALSLEVLVSLTRRLGKNTLRDVLTSVHVGKLDARTIVPVVIKARSLLPPVEMEDSIVEAKDKSTTATSTSLQKQTRRPMTKPDRNS